MLAALETTPHVTIPSIRPQHRVGDARPVVLLIDDSSGEAKLLQQALDDAGVDMRVSAVRSIDDLRAMARCAPSLAPQLVLLDATLAFTSSESVFLMVRCQAEWAMTPIIIFNQAYRPNERDYWHLLGASACWTKPDDWDGHLSLAREIDRTLALPRA